MFAESTNRWPIWKIGGRFWLPFGRLSVREKSVADLENRWPISRAVIFQKRIFGPDLLQFYGSFFYYKYRHCISVNLEIEGAETRV